MVLCFTQCKKPVDNTETGEKVKVRCEIPINGGKSDFTNLMENGSVNWSDGRECVYLAIHGTDPQIIELEAWSDGNQPSLEFEGEAAAGLIVSGEEYDVWYFGHSQQLSEPYVDLADDGSVLTGSIATQSGRLGDLGYNHIAKTTVTAETVDGEVVLDLNGTLKNQMAIALLDLENVTELYGDAIAGTEYTLSYNGERYELEVSENAEAGIKVESASGISYVVLFPNGNKETIIKHKQGNKTYAYTFHNYIKSNRIYHRVASDGVTPEALKWEEYEEEEPGTPDLNGHEYVDLGLPSGLKWATCNVGANAPEEYGNYYAWGETEPAPNNNYSSSNCSAYGLSISQLQSQGYIDGDGNLTSSHDAARANWGGSWRMPTEAEQQELLNNCTWTWTTQNGVNGYKVASKTNGNSIFLPAAGIRSGSSLIYAGSYGFYWSSTPDEGNSNYAYYLFFYSSNHYVYYYRRNYGQSVRPVSE